ncbi:MAG: hypothetical protein ACTSUS_01085 [Candidatus Freyarchaeota archaeon]
MKLRKSLVVSNAGPLIHLAKTNLLRLLKDLYQEVVIPREVKVEAVDRGKERGFSDAVQIEDAISQGWIKVEEVKITEEFASTARVAGLRVAEAAVIYYAYKNKAAALLDEDSARVFARTLGIPIRGSLGIILEGLKRSIISRTEALIALEKLSDVMYLSADLYRVVRRKIEEM